MNCSRFASLLFFAFFLSCKGIGRAQGLFVPQTLAPQGTQDCLQKIRALQQPLRVLYVAAHPDDENTRLLAYFSKGRNADVRYLSLTHGEGGQNLMGPDVGTPLGAIRTQELYAARRVDGAQQLFGPCADFGYSKSADETWKKWDAQTTTAEMVGVIRSFQPHVVITRFSPDPAATHGHHTASAQAALWAVDSAQLSGYKPSLGKPWKVAQTVWNTSSWFFASGKMDTTALRWVDVGEWHPEVGQSFGEIAAASRSMHKSQGFGSAATRGRQKEYFQLLRGEWPTQGVFVQPHTEESLPKPIYDALSAAAQALNEGNWDLARKKAEWAYIQWSKITDRPACEKSEFAELLTALWGLQWEVRGPLHAVQGQAMEVTWRGLARVSGVEFTVGTRSWSFPLDALGTENFSYRIATGHDSVRVNRGNISLELPMEVFCAEVDPLEGERYTKTFIKPIYTVDLKVNKIAFSIDSIQRITATVVSSNGKALGSGFLVWNAVYREVPGGPALAEFRDSVPVFSDKISTTIYPAFRVPSNFPIGHAEVSVAFVPSSGGRFDQSWNELNYRHLPRIGYPLPARVQWAVLPYLPLPLTVGVLSGSGDAAADALRSLGHNVVELAPDAAPTLNYNDMDALVIGVRAANVHRDVWSSWETVAMDLAKSGKTVLIQYQTTADLPESFLREIGFALGRSRVTDEEAPIKVVQANHSYFNYPFALNEFTWAGWTQERSLYHAEMKGTQGRSLLSSHDPGEADHPGLLVEYPVGKGRIVYCGLALFRQWPAGVPGSFELLANLVHPIETAK